MSRTPDARRKRREQRPRIEVLEVRTLLSADLIELPFPLPAGVNASIAAAPVNPTFDTLTGAAEVRLRYGVDGSGLAAAVIDTGTDYTHPALGGGFGSGQKVSGGYDLAMNDPDPRAETWSHGTMVAGLIASSAPEASGVAPGADVVPLRVFGNDNRGSFDLIADAMQWVIDNHERYNISVVNISLSDGGNYSSDPFLFSPIGTRIRGLIDSLRNLNIPVVAATGNSFNGQAQGMGYLAILQNTISVTATDQNGALVVNAQRLGASVGGAAATDLAAPGAGLLTTSDNGGFARVEGTSFAAPIVSGAVLLLQELYQGRFGRLPSVAELENWLKQGARPISDPATGITIGRLDIARSAALVPQPAASRPVSPPAATPTPPTVPLTGTPVATAGPPVSTPATPPPAAPPTSNPTAPQQDDQGTPAAPPSSPPADPPTGTVAPSPEGSPSEQHPSEPMQPVSEAPVSPPSGSENTEPVSVPTQGPTEPDREAKKVASVRIPTTVKPEPAPFSRAALAPKTPTAAQVARVPAEPASPATVGTSSEEAWPAAVVAPSRMDFVRLIRLQTQESRRAVIVIAESDEGQPASRAAARASFASAWKERRMLVAMARRTSRG